MLFNGDLQAGATRRGGGARHGVETEQRDCSGDNAAPPDDCAAAGCAAAARTPDTEARFFLALGIDRPVVAVARETASRNATTIECELLAAGVVDPHRYYETLARMLDLPYLETIAPEAVIQTRNIDSVLRRPEHLAVRIGGTLLDTIVPTATGFAGLMQRLHARPELRARLAVAAPATIRRAVWASRADERAGEAVLRLSAHHRERSASITVTGLQGFAAGLVLSSLVVGLLVVPGPFINAAHAILATFFLVCVVLRVVAFAAYRRPLPVNVGEAPAGPLPVYTVVVALHDESRMAGQLVRALMRLKWPRSLLDIKLICEADDDATIAALEALDLPREFEIVRVPPIGPRTKPKALAYALAGARGDYLVIYDAEDRPHPEQLREAYAIFANSGNDLAVIQAPLVISNAGASPVSAVFAMEYACLFRGLLPFLARHRLPIPLGGTSNHFRMDALMAVGAWDPYNVTEDADLGMRLYRSGYRATVMTRATQEDAPRTLKVWMRQRTRWFKGWLQTWLVLMRSPLTLWREMGPRGFLAFQTMVAGMLVSALGHMLLIGLIVAAAMAMLGSRFWDGAPMQEAMRTADIVNFFGGYLGFAALAWKVMIPEERRRVGQRWVWLPLYWVAAFAASWLAVIDLVRNPFYWAKTPHVPTVGASGPKQSGAAGETTGAIPIDGAQSSG